MKVVTICGSMRYAKEMMTIAEDLELKNKYAVLQCIYPSIDKEYTKEEEDILDEAHKKKIDISDGIYVVNINGYIGSSTKKEIEYATKTGKEIIYHEKSINEVNIMSNLKSAFEEKKRENPEMSLDELLFAVYDDLGTDEPFNMFRNKILEANNINELQYYTKNVNQELKDYIKKNIFPEYEKNDGGHNIVHILEVIRRTFALNDTFKLGLDDNMMFAMAACHDWGKYIDSDNHPFIAAKNFMNDEFMEKFFDEDERKTIKEAIEDHKSSKEDDPRSVYGKLISSADRNTRIEIVFIRSFFVAHERMPNDEIEGYLDYTIKRLSKRYSLENPENMFFEDRTYKEFLQDMRALLKKEEEFKNRYCEVNHISSRKHLVKEEIGETSYKKSLKI